jgi:2-polyprenyl-3-methyl-5-hydroxy-6-metoxy-1,4-benzoquinol methylase
MMISRVSSETRSEMRLLPPLANRDRQPELMDDPAVAVDAHVAALRGLRRINAISASAGILWPAIRKLTKSTPAPLRILDVASGGGDVLLGLWRRARRAGVGLELEGADISDTALSHARELARCSGATIAFRRVDVLNEPLPEGFDVVVSSLFLHHLAEADAIRLLRNMKTAARRLVLVNDLTRSRLGYVAAWCGTRILSRSPIVHVDGPRSVQAAFTIAEMRRLADEAGLHGATVSGRWPFRCLLQWRADDAGAV